MCTTVAQKQHTLPDFFTFNSCSFVYLFSSPGVFVSVSSVPVKSIKIEDFQAQLQFLLSHYNISYNTDIIKTSADELELYSMVIQRISVKLSRSVTIKYVVMHTVCWVECDVCCWCRLSTCSGRCLKLRKRWRPSCSTTAPKLRTENGGRRARTLL